MLRVHLSAPWKLAKKAEIESFHIFLSALLYLYVTKLLSGHIYDLMELLEFYIRAGKKKVRETTTRPPSLYSTGPSADMEELIARRDASSRGIRHKD